MNGDDDIPEGAVPGLPLGLHAVRDESRGLGDVLRVVLGEEVARIGPATTAWLEGIVEQANERGFVTLAREDLEAALQDDAPNVQRLRDGPRRDQQNEDP